MFQFRLQKVLELREKSEQETATRLAAARANAEAARRAHAELEAARDGGHAGFAANGNTATAGQLQNLSYLVDHLNRQIQHAHSVAEAADENVRRLLAEFTAAFQERRVLDRLRDRQQQEWRQKGSQQELRSIDDIAVSRFVRGAPHGPTTTEQ